MDLTDPESLRLLADSLKTVVTQNPSPSGAGLDAALQALGWLDMLDEIPGTAVPLVFAMLGENGVHAPLVNDVVARAAGCPGGGTVPLPFAGGSWVIWSRGDQAGSVLDGELPILRVEPADPLPPAALAAGRSAVGWWLAGASRAMLELARRHALDRNQFGHPIAAFQAVRHRLAEALVAIEGAEATLRAATDQPDELACLLAKAAAGQAALTTARHCQQVLAGIGFTAEHQLHHHVKRSLVLDGLLGSSRELTREAGAVLRTKGFAPRLAQL
ncbi:acyl-CoA dehydrogenase family protein [Mycobacterium marinum]|uniref:acyl-CoA dehydrogenase family protein n=1 Tax=Mycobacterium marinum TaxID=1781 RepID=UPI000B96BAB2|nr:acyl-CoA dehydrogenase family protein [Mycobacterium marinum]ULL12229.1 acyl-CoA dehydrogenase [Mycobacterium liflandii]MDC8983747.1 acyl-CoA dehydrogenase family protein [Mycobacterium marinum]MDC8994657.1 acyl-CoA dehydrogenase family protein [Mycobacterium marinum]MDC9000823.1 acyl-CoA dehydrogenase family protein [Mycobacterium marinum]MDC9011715.1 acyl-CoA dehydrogenase family protein [Mycobacterium marinum]